MKLSRLFNRKMLIIPPVVIGVVIFITLKNSREPSEQHPPGEESRVVRVIEAQESSVIPRALGYGVVQPGSVWQSLAEVGGKVVYAKPDLDPGALITSGTLLFRIEPRDYELTVKKNEAAVQSTEAQLEQLNTEEENYRKLLEIEERLEESSKRELERKRSLLEQGTLSQSVFDQEERAYLAQTKAAQNLRNSLALIPSRHSALEASLIMNRSQLEEAKLNLSRTKIIAPIDCRIGKVNVEQDQYAPPGALLCEADGIEISEVMAQIPVPQFAQLIRLSKLESPMEHGLTSDIIAEWIESAGFSALIRFHIAADHVAEYKAEIVRISPTIDPETRTIGVVVAARDTYRHAIPGIKPPLMRGMYCEVEVRTLAQEGMTLAPRTALLDGRLMLCDKNNRLELREVMPALAQSDWAAFDKGIESGERIVVSDITPKIPGMLLEPKIDKELAKRLRDSAANGERLR